MIYELKNNELEILNDDPVRPHIDFEKRISGNKKVYVLKSDDKIDAVICSALTNKVPKSEDDLDESGDKVCVFYTVWSYSKGAGRTIVNEIYDFVKKELPSVTQIVTLSPKTEMARKFHLQNGAFELQENIDSINYEYPM